MSALDNSEYVDSSFSDLVGIIKMLESDLDLLKKKIISYYDSGLDEVGYFREDNFGYFREDNPRLYDSLLDGKIEIDEYLSHFGYSELIEIFESQCCQKFR